MLYLEVLVPKARAIDAHAAGSIAIRHVAPLCHETGDDSMEARALVADAALAGAKAAKVAGSSGHNLVEELEYDALFDVLPANANVEEAKAPGRVVRRLCDTAVFQRGLFVGRGYKTQQSEIGRIVQQIRQRAALTEYPPDIIYG